MNPTGAWLQAARAGRAAAAIRDRRSALQAARRPGRTRLPALHRARAVREGRLPRLRHGPHGALVRAVDRRGRAAQDRGGRGDRPHRRAARGHAPALPARPREPEPARRPRAHGRARAAAQGRRVQDLHAVGTGREGLLARRRARPRDDREGAQARREEHRDPQGAAVRAEVVRALDLPRRRPRREALSRRQLPDLPLGLRAARRGRAVRPEAHRRRRRARHEPRRERRRARARTSTRSWARRGGSACAIRTPPPTRSAS